ncbi:MAG TPA: hypothetical protein VJU87_13200 [Gemmatimonadaceae bacterium]|nr:hypothetical protein [Gemmatimonadaceae bacterium]
MNWRRPAGLSTLTALLIIIVIVVAVAMVVRSSHRHAIVGAGARDTSSAGGTVGSPTTRALPPSAIAPAPGGGLPVVARKPAPVSPGFEGCPAVGDHGDAALNRLKNRVDSAVWIPVAFDSVLALPWPSAVERRARDRWSRGATSQVKKWEGLPLSIEGYFVGGKLEGPESPNCHGADAPMRDWHLWLAAQPGRDRRQAIVVETTPVIRATHPAWSLTTVHRLVRDSTPVRVSGWLMLDPEHPEQVGKTRGTIWEIHPILRIEARVRGRWVPLDSLRQRGR